MQRDIAAGSASELDYLLGGRTRLREATKAKTPLHRFLYHALWPRSDKREEERSFERIPSPL